MRIPIIIITIITLFISGCNNHYHGYVNVPVATVATYDYPRYDDSYSYPYYFYNNRYYYGGTFRGGYYHYKGHRYTGGRYYTRNNRYRPQNLHRNQHRNTYGADRVISHRNYVNHRRY